MRHRVKGVRDRDDFCFQRNVLVREARGITLAIRALMVVPNPIGDFSKLLDFLQDSRAKGGVLLDVPLKLLPDVVGRLSLLRVQAAERSFPRFAQRVRCGSECKGELFEASVQALAGFADGGDLK